MERFMGEAITKAKIGIKKGQTPFGACIVKGNKIIANSHNTVWQDNDPTAHAEINCIREACKNLKTIDLSGCTIYSTTEPCPMCFAAIHWARIDKIIYGASIKDAKKAGFNELEISNEELKKKGNIKIKIEKGILKKECKELFDIWKKKGKKAY